MTAQVVLAHSGKQHSYRTALALQQGDMLQCFITSSYYKPGRFPDRFAGWVPGADAWMRRRSIAGLDEDRVMRHSALELPEVAYRMAFGDDEVVQRLVAARDRKFDRTVAQRLPALRPKVYWTYEGSAGASVEVARAAGARTVIEFAGIAQPGRVQGIPRADVYVAASSFSARSLQSAGIDGARVRVLPLGADLARFTYRAREGQGTLRVLFMGKLSRHKGIHLLLDAMRQLRGLDIRLSVAGPDVGQHDLIRPFEGTFEKLGALEGGAVVAAMHAHDVLVVPSLHEGFGMVIVEAMATGMPVIATASSCAPDVIREGVDGFVIPSGERDAIAERLEWCARHREALPPMGVDASMRARDFSWERHAERVRDLARELMATAGPPA